MNTNATQNPGNPDLSTPPAQKSNQHLLRNGRLLLAGLFILVTMVIARQLINPIETRNWFEVSIAGLALVVSDALIIWLFVISFSINSVVQYQDKLIKQINRQKITAEKTFTQQTEDLKRYLEQDKVLIEILSKINNRSDLQTFIEQVVNLTQDRFHLYYAGIFLLDEQGKNALLRAGSGEAGTKMIADNHSLLVNETSMVGWAITNRKPRVSLDVEAEPIHYKNPELPLTRSELALPLISHGAVLGALTFQSSQPSAFDEEDMITFQGIAAAVSSTVDNSRLNSEIKKYVDEINHLHQKYLESAWNQEIKLNPNLSYTYEKKSREIEKKSGGTFKIPMTLRGQTLGYLDLETEGENLSSEEMALIETIINQTAISLENARLLEETQKQVNQEHYLTDLTTRFSTALDIDQILNLALKELGQLPLVSEASVYLKSPDSDDLETSRIATGGQNV